MALRPSRVKADFLAVAFDPFLQPRGLFGVGDVHVLQREGAAIGALHDVDDLAHRGTCRPSTLSMKIGRSMSASVKP
jgi:hypothetical protein